MATEADTPPQALAELLLAFGAAPGQYPVRLGEPRLLYREMDTVAAWAIGRVPPALKAQAGPLAKAAVLFVLRACFARGNTHYQVLGLPAGAIPPEKLRSRYRALIRLTHPDMAVQGLPPDAAGIVNHAHEVLSDPDLRARYDEELAERAAERAATRPQRGRVRAEVARIVPKVGWGERLASLAARYPAQVRVLSTAAVVGVAGVALLSLAARDIDRGRTLVVAETLVPADGLQPIRPDVAGVSGSPLLPPSGMLDAGPRRQAAVPAVSLPSNPAGAQTESEPPAAERTFQRVAVEAPPPMVPPPDWRRIEAGAPRPRDSALSMEVAMTPPSSSSVQPAQAPLGAPSAGPATPAAEYPARTAPVAAAAPARPSGPPSDKPAEPASRTGSLAYEARPASTDYTSTTAANSAAATAGDRVWTVDTVGSLDYLHDIVNALERPSRALQTQRYLRDMRVKGTLLQPALDLMTSGSRLQVTRLDVTDVERPGVLNLRGTLEVQASRRTASDTRSVRYRLNAEFWGTRDGTVLGVLDMREAD